jgi:hypothetical protein
MTVASIIAAQQSIINDTLAQANGYLQNLVDHANVLLIGGVPDLPTAYNFASVPVVTFPVFTAVQPNVTGLNLGSPPTAPNVSFSSLAPIALPVDDLILPTSVFQFAEAAYQSTLLNPLKAKLLTDLTNGGYGIDPTDDIALFNRARDREVEAMSSRIADAGRAMASRGFPLPPGELSIHVDRAYQEMQDKVSDVSRSITLERAKLFVDNRQFTIREVRELEHITINFWNSIQERSMNVSRLTVELSIAAYNALLARYRARLDAAKITADMNVASAHVDVARAQAAFEIFRSQIAGYEAQLRSVIEPAKLQVELYRANVDSARAINDAFIAKTALQQKVLEATVTQNIEFSKMTMENARVRLLGVVESLKFQTAASEFGATKFFALLSALEGTINTLAVQSATE